MHKSQQLKHLCRVLDAILEARNNVSFPGEELETKVNVAWLVCLYVEVILWFFNAGLLPEVSEMANPEVLNKWWR